MRSAQSPFNERLLMRYQKWNLSRITITTPTTIRIKCLLLSQWNNELCTVHCNDIHTRTNWAVSVRKTSKQTNEQEKKAPWISIQIPHLHRIYLDFIGAGKKAHLYMFENEKNREMNTQIRLQTRKDHYTILFNSRFEWYTCAFWKAFR